MNVQVIMRDGAPEYAVVPWDEYQALLTAVGRSPAELPAQEAPSTASPSLNELPALRESRAMSVDALAKAVGISPAYLGLIESGERNPDAAIRRALARALGVPGWREDA